MKWENEYKQMSVLGIQRIQLVPWAVKAPRRRGEGLKSLKNELDLECGSAGVDDALGKWEEQPGWRWAMKYELDTRKSL